MSDFIEQELPAGSIYLGTVKTGTLITHQMLADMIERRPRQQFDIELKAMEIPNELKKISSENNGLE